MPRCAGPCGGRCCLRPNVMIFGDDMLVGSRLQQQRQNKAAFKTEVEGATVGHLRGIRDNLLVLEIGAGVVVPSIRYSAESAAETGSALVRINPSAAECAETETGAQGLEIGLKYFPIVARGSEAIAAIMAQLEPP